MARIRRRRRARRRGRRPKWFRGKCPTLVRNQCVAAQGEGARPVERAGAKAETASTPARRALPVETHRRMQRWSVSVNHASTSGPRIRAIVGVERTYARRIGAL